MTIPAQQQSKMSTPSTSNVAQTDHSPSDTAAQSVQVANDDTAQFVRDPGDEVAQNAQSLNDEARSNCALGPKPEPAMEYKKPEPRPIGLRGGAGDRSGWAGTGTSSGDSGKGCCRCW